MKIKLLSSNEIITGDTAEEVVNKFSEWRNEPVEEYMAGFVKRFELTYGITLFYRDAESFLRAIHETGKFLEIIE